MGCGMLIVIGKSGGIGKNCIGAAKLLGTAVHHLYKIIYRTSHMLCNLQSDIIGRGYHDGVQTLLHSENLPGVTVNGGASSFNSVSCLLGKGELCVYIQILTAEKTSEKFGNAGWVKLGVGILGIQDRFCI